MTESLNLPPFDFAAATALSAAARDAIDRLNTLINHTPDCSTAPDRADDAHDLADIDARIILTMLDDSHIPTDDTDLFSSPDAPLIAHLLQTIAASPYHRDFISTLALAQSLCPLHLCDYAACFDDDDAECSQIRAIFPSHDT